MDPKQTSIKMNNTQNIAGHQPFTASTSVVLMQFQRQAHNPKSLPQNWKKQKEHTQLHQEQSSQTCLPNQQNQGLHMTKSRTISDNCQIGGAHSKLKAQREKFNRIKAKQLELTKKAQSILSNSSSSNSPSKLKSSQSTQNPLIEESNPISMSPNKKAIYKPNASKCSKKQTIKIKNNFGTQVFYIIKFINEGCYGKVYLAMHELTGFIVCLKIIDRNFLDETTFSQLIREIKIQSFVNHPNIVNFYQFFVDQNYVYLLLEPCLGNNLYQLMSKRQRNCLQQKQVKRYIKEIGSALQYLHKLNVIHRDVKPENILIHQNSAKLCDFGWAVHSPLLRDTQCGTPLYICPEILKNESYDSKIDIWCIGVLTFQLLYGEPPFKIRNINDMAKIVNEDINFTNEVNVSDSAVEFIKGCLQKSAIRRFSIRRVLEHDFIVNTRGNEKFRNTIS